MHTRAEDPVEEAPRRPRFLSTLGFTLVAVALLIAGYQFGRWQNRYQAIAIERTGGVAVTDTRTGSVVILGPTATKLGEYRSFDPIANGAAAKTSD